MRAISGENNEFSTIMSVAFLVDAVGTSSTGLSESDVVEQLGDRIQSLCVCVLVLTDT
jgi:hypothetical protein